MRYICLCGQKFRNKNLANSHQINMKIINDHGHAICKKNLSSSFMDFLCFLFIDLKALRSIGAALIWVTVIHHFSINFNFFELTMIGLGMGLLL